jgi:hypothetical protein
MTNAWTQIENPEREFSWMPDSWWCGTSDQRCRYCGLPTVWAPASAEISTCACDRTPVDSAMSRGIVAPLNLPHPTQSRLHVQFERPVEFTPRIRLSFAESGLSARCKTRKTLSWPPRSANPSHISRRLNAAGCSERKTRCLNMSKPQHTRPRLRPRRCGSLRLASACRVAGTAIHASPTRPAV